MQQHFRGRMRGAAFPGCHDRFRAGMSSCPQKDTPARRPSLPAGGLLHAKDARYDGRMRQFHLTRVLPLALLATLCFAQDGADPWPKANLLEPAALAREFTVGQTSHSPGCRVPSAVSHEAHSTCHRRRPRIEAGRDRGAEEGRGRAIEGCRLGDLLRLLPMEKCPNVRPPYRVLKEMGFTRVRVLRIPTNMQATGTARTIRRKRAAPHPCPRSNRRNRRQKCNADKVRRSCPHCGSHKVRLSIRQGVFDWLVSVLMLSPCRCRGCRRRFYRFGSSVSEDPAQ
jgi:hypothetical protein